MTSVAFVSPAHGRFAVTKLVLEQRQRLIRELAAGGIDAVSIIVACDENLEIAREHGCQTVEAANRPLGRKCNIGLQAAAGQADYVVWVGADDWIHPDAFKPLARPWKRGPRIIVGRRIAIVDVPRGLLQQVATPSKYGSIPWILDSRLLHPHTDLVREDLNFGMDGALIRGLRRVRRSFLFVLDDPHAFRCVDFKTEESVTPYGGLAKHLATGPEEPAWQALADWYPADLVEQARAIAFQRTPARARVRRPVPDPRQPRKPRRTAMRIVHPETGQMSMVSRKGMAALRARGWQAIGVPSEEVPPLGAPGMWPDTHSALNELGHRLAVDWPPAGEGRTRLTVAEKVAALEASGHPPQGV